MFTILLHSSKTMRVATEASVRATAPQLLKQATQLADYTKSLSSEQIQGVMKVSPTVAEKTRSTMQAWSNKGGIRAIDAFLGDIYSGLQVQALSDEDKAYAQQHLRILSGLYGVLRPLDIIRPYRLEMGYKLTGNTHDNSVQDVTSLYKYWGDAIAKTLPSHQTIVNLSAVEYSKAVLPYLPNTRVITPKFLTVSPKTGEPTFVTVHAKIARGAYAHWMIKHRVESIEELKQFRDLGYEYDAAASSLVEPVFVAKDFKGLGLSVRLT